MSDIVSDNSPNVVIPVSNYESQPKQKFSSYLHVLSRLNTNTHNNNKKKYNNNNFSKWLKQALEDGAGPAHKYANGPNQPEQRKEAWTNNDQANDTPITTMRARRQEWAGNGPHTNTTSTTSTRQSTQPKPLPNNSNTDQYQ